MLKITDDIFRIVYTQEDDLPDVNSYFVKSKKLLIDAGPDSLQNLKILKNSLREANMDLSDIEFVIVTHHHLDHSGLLSRLPSNIKVIAPDNLKYYGSSKYLDDISTFFSASNFSEEFSFAIRKNFLREYSPALSNLKYIPYKQSKTLQKNLGIEITQMIGHSSSDLIIKIDNFLFTGDIVLPKVFFNCIFELDEKNQMGQSGQRSSYKKELDFILMNQEDLVLPGHSHPLNKDETKKIINDSKRRMRRTETRVRKLLEQGELSIEEVSQSIFGSFMEYSTFLPFSDICSIFNE